MTATIEEAIARMEAGFWRRYKANPDLQRKLAGKSRIIQLAFKDGDGYTFHIVDGRLDRIEPGVHPKANATVTVAKDDLLAILNGDLKAMQAYMTGRVKVKASFGDMLFAKSIIG